MGREFCCACQPRQWEFILDFSRHDCLDTNILTEAAAVFDDIPSPGGISSISCSSSMFTLDQRDYWQGQLNVVDSIEIREYDRRRNWMPLDHYVDAQTKQDRTSTVTSTIHGPLHNGETFSYLSVLQFMPPPKFTTTKNGKKNQDDHVDDGCGLPASIQVQLYGKNKALEPCEFDFSLFFNLECGVSPVIRSGDYLGPITVIAALSPSSEFCPLES